MQGSTVTLQGCVIIILEGGTKAHLFELLFEVRYRETRPIVDLSEVKNRWSLLAEDFICEECS